jgi:hypothetical protein
MGADRLGPTVGHVVERRDELGVDDHRAQRAREEPEAARCERDAGGRGHDLLELVRLVDHDQVVFGQQGAVHREMHAIEVGVHDHDVGSLPPRSGVLGEALVTPRASERAGALVPTDRDRTPGGDARLPRELGAITGVGVLGPRDQSAHLVSQRGGCRVDAEIELPVLAGLHLGDALPAHIVGPSLEDGP